MSMTILVVGRGSEPDRIGANRHRFVFLQSSQLESGIINIEQFDFVFQHLGPANSEASAAVEEWLKKHMESRIIGFRGGVISPQWYSRGITLMPNVGDVLALPWAMIPEDFNGDAQSLARLLRPTLLALLPALAILCQGYLAVHATQGDKIGSWAIEDALHQMGWNDQEHARLVRADTATVQDASWWLDIFNLRTQSKAVPISVVDEEKWHDFSVNLAAEWGSEGTLFLDGPFMQRLHRNQPLNVPRVVADVYLAIMKRLGSRGNPVIDRQD